VFEFVPFDGHPPDEGVVVDVRIPNHDYAEEMARYMAALELNPFAENDICETFTPRLTDSPEALVGADEVCVSTPEVTLIVGYPFADQYAVTITANTPSGFTRADLFRQLVRVYSAMYEGAAFSTVEHLDNTHVQSPRFGEAWHVIEDLVVEEVLVERRERQVFAWIHIGS
jgi:hypothetical protein